MGGAQRVSICGDVVRRPAAPWTETVHSLLSHLRAAGLPVPEPLGIEGSVEQVRFVPGAAGDEAWPHQVSVGAVRSAGALLRAVHEATRGWVPPPSARWAVGSEGGPTICHGDPKPPNFAWRDGAAVGLFDWDVARPAPPTSDIAYALYWFAPFDDDDAELARRGLPINVDARARIDAFLEGYGWTEPFDVLEAVAFRRRQAVDEVIHLGAQGVMPQAQWVDDGWPQQWRKGPQLRG
ncbi:phosphotransferase enzyme family protein [Oryzobacter telluris]|uniref:phosphotransferase enzyme family protein n=1 Tax=Oryzobacter telluris TaxID=3149179 RepID=UPI00370DD305